MFEQPLRLKCSDIDVFNQPNLFHIYFYRGPFVGSAPMLMLPGSRQTIQKGNGSFDLMSDIAGICGGSVHGPIEFLKHRIRNLIVELTKCRAEAAEAAVFDSVLGFGLKTVGQSYHFMSETEKPARSPNSWLCSDPHLLAMVGSSVLNLARNVPHRRKRSRRGHPAAQRRYPSSETRLTASTIGVIGPAAIARCHRNHPEKDRDRGQGPVFLNKVCHEPPCACSMHLNAQMPDVQRVRA